MPVRPNGPRKTLTRAQHIAMEDEVAEHIRLVEQARYYSIQEIAKRFDRHPNYVYRLHAQMIREHQEELSQNTST